MNFGRFGNFGASEEIPVEETRVADLMLMGEVFHKAMFLLLNGGSIGNLSTIEGAEIRPGPSGTGSAMWRERGVSLLLSESSAVLTVENTSAAHFALVIAGSVTRHAFGVEPEWDIQDDGNMDGTLTLTPHTSVTMRLRDADVDVTQSGTPSPGAVILMESSVSRPRSFSEMRRR